MASAAQSELRRGDLVIIELADLGEDVGEVEFEPFPESVPEPEVVPESEPVPVAVPEEEPVPA